MSLFYTSLLDIIEILVQGYVDKSHHSIISHCNCVLKPHAWSQSSQLDKVAEYSSIL